MRAVVMREFGAPEVLRPADVDEVTAGPGQVIIEAEFANVTFVETQIRAGRAPHPSMLPALPAILGNGTGGRVAAGSTGAGAGRPGRPVVASLNGTGGYAERVVADARRLIEVPDGVTLRDAVALLADGRTALGLVRRAGLRAGETVLVEAAAGGVGTLLVQLARHAGARVVALAGQPGKLALARDLGADLTVDYRRGDGPRPRRAASGRSSARSSTWPMPRPRTRRSSPGPRSARRCSPWRADRRSAQRPGSPRVRCPPVTWPPTSRSRSGPAKGSRVRYSCAPGRGSAGWRPP